MSAKTAKQSKTAPLFARLLLGRSRATALIDLVDENRGADGARRRRSFPILTVRQDAAILPRKRNLGVAAARHERINNADAKSFDRALRVHVVGDKGKPFFRDKSANRDWFAAAETFWKRWSHHADFVTGASWRECLKKVVSAIAFEGDVVCLFDDGVLSSGKGSGRFAFFSADRICPLAEGDFDAWRRETGREAWTQAGGALFNELGRFAGIVVSKKRGASETLRGESFILTLDPDDPDAAFWRHVSRPDTFDTVRATPDSFASLPSLIDSAEIRVASNVATKQSISRHAILKHDFASDADPRDLDDQDEDVDETAGAGNGEPGANEAGDGAGQADGARAPMPSFENLSQVVRGNSPGGVDVISKDDDFVVTPQTNPNLDVPAYLEEEARHAARAHGLPALLATLKADHSYSGARAEIALAEDHFVDLRQFIEDAFSDWVFRKLIGWAMETGRLDRNAPENWQDSLAWQYPRIPYLDPQKEAAAFVELYKAGLITYEDAGVRPEEIAETQKRDREIFEKAGLDHLSTFASTPGSENALATSANPGNTDPDDKTAREPGDDR